MDRRYQVMQYVAVVRGRWGRFMVFKTGDPKFYLFQPLLGDTTIAAEIQAFPIAKADLQPWVRSMLAHGCGNSL